MISLRGNVQLPTSNIKLQTVLSSLDNIDDELDIQPKHVKIEFYDESYGKVVIPEWAAYRKDVIQGEFHYVVRPARDEVLCVLNNATPPFDFVFRSRTESFYNDHDFFTRLVKFNASEDAVFYVDDYVTDWVTKKIRYLIYVY